MLITSADNPKVKLWEKLKQKKYRDEARLFLVEEKHLIEEALKANKVETLIIRDSLTNPFEMDAIKVSDNVMKKISNNTSLNDYIAVCNFLDVQEIKGNSFIVLENVQDPGNVGTIIRTAYSFGYDAVYLNESCASIYNHKTIQATQGALFHIPLIIKDTGESIEYLRSNSVRIIGTSLNTNNYLSKSNKYEKFALVYGNEGQGLTSETQMQCDEVVKIEMKNFDSLNVAIAMAISSYYYKF